MLTLSLASSAKDRKAEDEHCHWDCFRDLVESAGYNKGRDATTKKTKEEAIPDAAKEDAREAKEDATGKADEAAQ